ASVYALAIDPRAPSTLYAGTSANGVYKSTDGGGSWAAASNGLPSYSSVRALAIDPSVPSTLYVATFTSDPATSSSTISVYKSTDGGGSWAAASNGLPASAASYIGALVIDPSMPSTV